MALTGANGSRTVRIVVLGIPPSGNAMRRKYRDRFAYQALRNQWEYSIHYSLSHSEREWLCGMARAKQKMRVTISVAHKKLYDTDNLYSGVKPVLDSLKKLGLIYDDAPEYCEILCSQEKINDLRTTISIEDARQ